jgi:hypothetical protein
LQTQLFFIAEIIILGKAVGIFSTRFVVGQFYESYDKSTFF